MIFYVDNEVMAEFPFDIRELSEEVAGEVLRTEGCGLDVQVNLLVTDDEGIRQINKDTRDIDSPTDVLSFPNISYDAPGDFSVCDGPQRVDIIDPDTGLIFFGDIVINEKVCVSCCTFNASSVRLRSHGGGRGAHHVR